MAGKGQQAEVRGKRRGRGWQFQGQLNLESCSDLDKNKEGRGELIMALQRHAELAFGTEGAACCSWNLEEEHHRKVTTRKVSQELGTGANPNPLPKLGSDDGCKILTSPQWVDWVRIGWSNWLLVGVSYG
jgi:hypothetical protein